MDTNFATIRYKEVNHFNGTEKDLRKRIKYLTIFDKFFAIAILGSLFFAGYSLIHWDIFKSVFWERGFLVILFIALVMWIWAVIQERTFSNIQRIMPFTFIISDVEYEENGGMFVDAYKVDDEDRLFKYHFYFDTAFEFSYDFISLYQVNLNCRKDFYYCRKRVK